MTKQKQLNKEIKNTLQGFPLGKTIDEIQEELPNKYEQNTIQECLETLENEGKVMKVGKYLRWL